ERITLVFDPDAAGERAADRAVETFLAVPIDVRIAKLPDGLDADELLSREGGRGEFDTAIDAGEDALAWMVRRFRADLRSAESMSGRQQRLQALLQKLGELGFRSIDPLRRRFVLNALSEMVQVPAETLERSMPLPRTAAPVIATQTEPVAAPVAAEPPTPRHRARLTAERNFLAAVLGVSDRADLRVTVGDAGALPLAEAFTDEHFDHPDHRALWTLIAARLESGKSFRVQDIVADTSVPTLKLLAGELYETGSRRMESADATPALQAAAADLDRQLRTAAENPLPLRKDLDGTTLQAVLERRRKEGHRPGAIARAVRGEARTATAGPIPADSP
ncbi:MAG: toprim domain-containing protein, partial [Planctomycetota bacterium]